MKTEINVNLDLPEVPNFGENVGFVIEEEGDQAGKIKLFGYRDELYAATWDGTLVPYETIQRLMGRIFGTYQDAVNE